ncbi:amino acid permease-domain-containing protein [Lipomyces tetrasporus]
MLYVVVHALGELAVVFPVAGSFATYSTRFIDPAWGFAMGWNYAMQWLVVFPLELVAAHHAAVLARPCQRRCLDCNLLDAYHCRCRCWFIILGIVLVCGGGPVRGYIGGTYWADPGAFNHGFNGLCSVFVTAAFAFAGTELVGLAAAETENPRKTRITLFYIIALALVGLLVPYNSPQLLDAAASPFVIAIQNAGIAGLPSVINVVILISVLSVGNSSVYGCSRTLASLAEMGLAPKHLAYIDKSGRPLVAIIVTTIFGLDAAMPRLPKKPTSSTGSWPCQVCRQSSHGHRFVSHTSSSGIVGSTIGLILNVVVFASQFWVAVCPIGKQPTPAAFFQSFLAAPVVLTFFMGYKFWNRTKLVKPSEADLVNGRRDVDVRALVDELNAEREALRQRHFMCRVYKYWC